MDTKRASSIHVANTEIQRIILGGGILWERFPEWEKWSIKAINKWKVNQNSYLYDIQLPSEMVAYWDYNIDNDGCFVGVPWTGDYYQPNRWKLYPYKSKEAFYVSENEIGGKVSGYWYTTSLESSKKEKDIFIETVSAPEGTYPDNGIKDGFWYIKKK